MATKAEWFRYQAERSGPKRAKQPKKKSGPLAPKTHNESAKANRKALYALEDVAKGTRPSRKSTRKASNRQKTDVAFRMKSRNAEGEPKTRAMRVGGR
jgi:hypothetical protein